MRLQKSNVKTLMKLYGRNRIPNRMMNVEQGISNYEVSSGKSSFRHWTFDIGYSAVRFSTSPQVAEKFRSKTLNNENGIAIVVALMMLVVLTIIGMAATNTSMLETMMSVAEKERQQCFYTAESGIQHAKGLLMTRFVQNNAAKIAAGSTPDWDFAINGSVSGIPAATATTFAGGATWISNGNAGPGYTYAVKVWNNADSGSVTDDTDGLIYVRSTGTGPSGGSSSIEVILRGWVTSSGAAGGYSAQAGAGAGKSYTSDDMNAITTFTSQL